MKLAVAVTKLGWIPPGLDPGKHPRNGLPTGLHLFRRTMDDGNIEYVVAGSSCANHNLVQQDGDIGCPSSCQVLLTGGQTLAPKAPATTKILQEVLRSL